MDGNVVYQAHSVKIRRSSYTFGIGLLSFDFSQVDSMHAFWQDAFFYGFDRDMWLSRCRTIGAEDHDPPFRDEQRSWYDTLRDFVDSTGVASGYGLVTGFTF
jgi:hypothetical protein